ncbi:MAG: hypothetical protein PWP57_148 [Candidatus Atribacteria bacterium]|nr:hypothetical protein [Candidatus Atribacteria bacterium]
MTMRVGFSEIVITPPVGITLGGYSARKEPSCGVHDDLHVRSFRFVDGKEIFLLIVCEVLGLPLSFVEETRAKIARTIPINPQNVLIIATHTHSGPDLPTFIRENLEREWLTVFSNQIVGSALVAWNNLSEACLKYSLGSISGIGVNRRNPASGLVDNDVSVLVIEDKNKVKKGVIFNYACHPVVLGPDNLLITADYPGFTSAALKSVFGNELCAAFTLGACGDVNTGHSADLSAIGEEIPGRTFERAQSLGYKLAGEVVKGVESSREIEDKLIVKHLMVNLPLRKLSSLEKAEKKLSSWLGRLEEMEHDIPSFLEKEEQIKKEIVYAEVERDLAREIKRRKAQKEVKTELHVAILGDVALVFLPGEVFVEIGIDIKKMSPFENTIVITMANDYFGYLPTREAFLEGGYEAVASPFDENAAGIIEQAIEKAFKDVQD